MKKLNKLEFLTGFMMGIIPGLLIDLILLFLYNALCTWFGWVRLDVAWWMWIPLPLGCGLLMGNAIARLHLEDY